MRISIATTLVAGAATAHAFRNSSPFILFSSSPLPSTISSFSTDQLQSAADVVKQTTEFLSSCPSDVYYIITQPEVAASDLSSQTSVPNLRRALTDPSVQAKNVISEVVGMDSHQVSEQLVDAIQKGCHGGLPVFASGTQNTRDTKKIILSPLAALLDENRLRDSSLAMHDTELARDVFGELQGQKYTVIYVTSPAKESAVLHHTNTYDAVFQEAIHMDLKRNLGGREANVTIDRRPLFEKYNYFSPGLFMGLSVTLLLLSILSVGIKAISSLEVSYGAFDKEMGPAAHKSS